MQLLQKKKAFICHESTVKNLKSENLTLDLW